MPAVVNSLRVSCGQYTRECGTSASAVALGSQQFDPEVERASLDVHRNARILGPNDRPAACHAFAAIGDVISYPDQYLPRKDAFDVPLVIQAWCDGQPCFRGGGSLSAKAASRFGRESMGPGANVHSRVTVQASAPASTLTMPVWGQYYVFFRQSLSSDRIAPAASARIVSSWGLPRNSATRTVPTEAIPVKSLSRNLSARWANGLFNRGWSR